MRSLTFYIYHLALSGSMDTAVLSQYLQHGSPIIAGVERRLTILNGTSGDMYARYARIYGKCTGSFVLPYTMLIGTMVLIVLTLCQQNV